MILTDSLYVFDHKAVNMFSIVDPAETAESFLLICLFWSDIGSCVVSLARWCFVATHIVFVVTDCCLWVNFVIVIGVVYIAKLIA